MVVSRRIPLIVLSSTLSILTPVKEKEKHLKQNLFESDLQIQYIHIYCIEL